MADSIGLLNMANIAFLRYPPSATVTQTSAQSLGTGSWVSITLNSSQYDNYNGHSNVTNNSRYTAVVAGWYTVSGVVAFSANGTGERGARLAVNGSPVQGTAGFLAALSSNVTAVVTATRDILLNVGDYVEVQGWQTSGGSLNTAVFSDLACGMWVRFSHFA